jgi:hypothetical protein
MDNVEASDHLFVIANKEATESDPNNKIRGVTNADGGKVIHLTAADNRNDNIFSNNLRTNITRTATHEFGHAARLTHGSASGFFNLMTVAGLGSNVTDQQRSMMFYNQNNINLLRNSIGNQPNIFVNYYDERSRSYQSTTAQRLGFKYSL